MKSLKAVVVACCWLIFSPQAFGQMLLTEAQAIPFAQQTLASQLEPGLPARPFVKWFERTVGDSAGVNWQLRNCGEQKGGLQSYKEDPQACVEVTAMFPNDRMVVVLTDIGVFDKATLGKPKIRYIVVEEYGRLQQLKKLSDLQATLRQSPQKPKKSEAASPRLLPIASPAAGLSLAGLNAPARIEIETTPGNMDTIIGEAPAPPPPATVSPAKGKVPVVAPAPATVIAKAQPVYPAFARQINASGEVKVTVQINAAGRVTMARATSGHPVLQMAAEDAARRWVFNPATLDGKPIPSEYVVTFSFVRP
jgi:TonB family protein